MTTVPETIHDFENRYLAYLDGSETTLEELWNEYNSRYPSGVDRVDFRWCVEQVLPESIGIRKAPDSDEITYVGIRCGVMIAESGGDST